MFYHLAQINIARLIAPLDDPKLADFVAQLDPVNAALTMRRALSGAFSRHPATPPTLPTATTRL